LAEEREGEGERGEGEREGKEPLEPLGHLQVLV
jgi:hypothetical protein